MPLPATVPVKISSEAAGYLTMTSVVRQELPLAEFIETILRVTGKDAVRIRDILRQGVVVSSASRFRWEPLEAASEEITQLLETFPDPWPERAFDPTRCVRAALTGGRAAIELTREAASRKRWLQRRSFWEAILAAASQLTPVYQRYSYADRADVYRIDLSAEAARALHDQAALLRYSSLEMQVREYSYDGLDLWVER